MCLNINSERLIAKEPIVVFKCLDVIIDNKVYETPFQYMPVNFDRTGKVTLKAKMKIYHGEVEEGIHAYSDIYNAYETSKEFSQTEVFTGIIPKGTAYYLGDCGDIVAEKMIIYQTNDSMKRIFEDIANFYKRNK